VAQHRVVVRPNEAARQGRHRHMVAVCDCAGLHLGIVLFKSAMSEDCQLALRGHKGLLGTKLGLDEDLTPT
jgi:hypothetical protein